MSCEHCQARVVEAALEVAGVSEALVDLAAGTLTIRGGDPAAVIRAVAEAGYPAELQEIGEPSPCAMPKPVTRPTAPQRQLSPKNYLLYVEDMHCASCVGRVEQAILAVEGVRQAAVNLVEKSASVGGGDPGRVVAAIVHAGYRASVVADEHPSAEEVYEIDILGMHCASCVRRVEEAILAVSGVTAAAVNLIEKKAQVRGGTPDMVVQAILDQGYGASLRQRPAGDTFFVTLHSLPETVDLEQIRQVLLAQDTATGITLEGERLRIATSQHPADVLLRLADIGYQAVLEESFADPGLQQAEETRREIRRSWQRAILAGFVGGMIMVGHMSGLFPHPQDGQLFWAGAALLCLLTMVFSGRSYYVGAWKQARHGAANMDTLVALGTGAAWVSSVVVIADPEFIPGAGNNLYLDASVMILAFLQLGHALEVRAKRTTSEAIGALVGLRVRTAWVIRAAGQVEMPVSLLRLGDRVKVKPGEKVPIDGEIVEGRTTIDESMLTGEPLAVARQIGDPVTGGTMNRSGVFVLRVTRLGDETTLARIIRMVKTAQMSKPPIGRLVDKIAGVFVPVVLCISLVTFFAWLGFASELRLAHALTAAIAVLVIACPCALGLATPTAIMVGTGLGAQRGVLFRNATPWRRSATIDTVVMDKTGTLTKGEPGGDRRSSRRRHPRSRAAAPGGRQPGTRVRAPAGRRRSADADANAAPSAAGRPSFRNVPGRGVRAQVDGRRVLVGNQQADGRQGLVTRRRAGRPSATSWRRPGGTPVWWPSTAGVAADRLADAARETAAAAVAALQQAGDQVVMLTGDNQATAEADRRAVGIDEVHQPRSCPRTRPPRSAELQQPGGKVGHGRRRRQRRPGPGPGGHRHCHRRGTDVAIETADITLTGDCLLLVATAIAISSATIRNIKQNLFGAFIYNVIGIPLAAGLFYPFTGWLLEPMFASAAMALSSVTVVTNANRLRFFRSR